MLLDKVKILSVLSDVNGVIKRNKKFMLLGTLKNKYGLSIQDIKNCDLPEDWFYYTVLGLEANREYVIIEIN